jgi:hypothetical protein
MMVWGQGKLIEEATRIKRKIKKTKATLAKTKTKKEEAPQKEVVEPSGGILSNVNGFFS